MGISYDKLFKIMKAQGLTKTELTAKAKISTNQMAHLSKNETVQLTVLYKLCRTLGCQLCDIVEFDL